MDIKIHKNYNNFVNSVSSSQRIICFSKSGETPLSKFIFEFGDIIMFGREDLGLPLNVIDNSSSLGYSRLTWLLFIHLDHIMLC